MTNEKLVPVTAETLSGLVQRPVAAPVVAAVESGTERVDAGALADLRRRADAPDALRRELARRIGLAAETPVALLLAGLDEALDERAADPPPEGTVLVDETALAELRRDAEAGRNVRHNALVADAVRTGRIPPASRESWLSLLENDAHARPPWRAETRNRSVSAIGYANVDEERDALYDEVFGR